MNTIDSFKSVTPFPEVISVYTILEISAIHADLHFKEESRVTLLLIASISKRTKS
jgi:hypothetical protein